MKIYETKDYQEMSRQAANILSAQVILKPDCVLGLATGSTPIGTYDQLVDWYNKGDVDFSQVRTVNLDEYRGLTRDNDQSYYYFMHKHLFDRVNRADSVTIVNQIVVYNSECGNICYGEMVNDKPKIIKNIALPYKNANVNQIIASDNWI